MNTTEDGHVVVNGEKFDPETAQKGLSLVRNSSPMTGGTLNRSDIISRAGVQYDGDRDIYDVLGYEEDLKSKDYRAKYERLDIASRVVELPPDDTWRKKPELYDTERKSEDSDFQDDIETLDREKRLFHYLHRFDLVSGIGEYGLLLIGLEDGQPLEEEPAEGTVDSPEDVAFFTPFAQDRVENWKLGKEEEKEPTDERYNLPVKYHIDFGAYNENDETDLHWVHWKRIVHAAENKVETDLRGQPRLKPIYNRLIDYEKVLGSSAEMFWTGAAPRYHFNIDTDQNAEIPDDKIEDLDDEVTAFVHEMQSYLKTFDTDVEIIGGEEVDPRGVLEYIISAIAGQSGIPQRVLTGSERGELASSQDRANWFDRVRTRQNQFAEPEILRQTIDRLEELGVISEPESGKYEVEWPDLFELNEVEMSEVQQNRASIAQQFAPRGNTALLPGSMGDWAKFVRDGEFPEEVIEGDVEAPPEAIDSDDVYGEPDLDANARFRRGQKVMFNDREAVIQDVKTDDFENHMGQTIGASRSDPQYILVTIEGLAYAEENEIIPESWSTDVSTPESDLEPEIVGNVYEDVDDPADDAIFDAIQDTNVQSVNAVTMSDVPGLDDPGIGFDSWPDSWVASEKPARLIALDAWVSMNAQFDCGGGCCMGEMTPKLGKRGAQRFCAAFKDEMLMTTHWRNRF